MSDLQVSLLIIGAVVVGGVTAFNWFQQWRLRRKLEQSFGDKPDDVLLRDSREGRESNRENPEGRQYKPREPVARVEPQLHPARLPDEAPDAFDQQSVAADPA